MRNGRWLQVGELIVSLDQLLFRNYSPGRTLQKLVGLQNSFEFHNLLFYSFYLVQELFMVKCLFGNQTLFKLLVFYFNFGLYLVDLTLYCFDWSFGERVRIVFLDLLRLTRCLLLLDEETLDLLPTLVTKDLHRYFQLVELWVGPSSNSVHRVWHLAVFVVDRTLVWILGPFISVGFKWVSCIQIDFLSYPALLPFRHFLSENLQPFALHLC